MTYEFDENKTLNYTSDSNALKSTQGQHHHEEELGN